MSKKSKKISKKEGELVARIAALGAALEASYEERESLTADLGQKSIELAMAREEIESFADLARGAAVAIQDLGQRTISGAACSRGLSAATAALGATRDALGATRSVLGALLYMKPDPAALGVVEAALGLIEEASEVSEEGLDAAQIAKSESEHASFWDDVPTVVTKAGL